MCERFKCCCIYNDREQDELILVTWVDGILRSTSHGILRATELTVSLQEIKNDIFMICLVSFVWSEVWWSGMPGETR